MNKLKVAVIFASGVASGAFGAWYFLKEKYKRIAQEEIDSVKETFTVPKDAEPEKVEEEPKKAKLPEKPDITEYAKRLSDYGYTKYSDNEEDEEYKVAETIEERAEMKPYVIAPEQFREFDDYDVVGIHYFADGAITDDELVILEDVEGTIGTDAVNHFGEYDDDSVYVRNERLKIDFEILRDQRSYCDDVLKSMPYLMEE